ncbi:helix-turn-helix domain-containing protein [Actinoplanes sp. NPDC049316]|uniref:helix-turn-helix domain-containing protein n=1 Tax=Actinoplanes sp. NPDC049316 TaxID=3154727 RepID=UPI00341F5A2C
MPATATRAIPDASTNPTISVKQAAAILGISVRHAYVAIQRGEIPSIRISTKIVIPTARFLAQYQLEPTAPVSV